MTKQYHILNGDSLNECFPKGIPGERIITRECLVDGSVAGNNPDEFFQTRAQFIADHFSGFTRADYFEKTVTELQKMQAIPEDAEINLWFEDDLFCQVNLWFVVHLLHSKQKNRFFLIRPKARSPYSFARLSEAELISVYESRQLLSETTRLARVWEAYQKDDNRQLLDLAKELKDNYPFVLSAVEAHLERLPSDGNPGRPVQTLIQIMEELNTTEFGPVFQEFCRREEIYGFGDLQVKRLVDEILSRR